MERMREKCSGNKEYVKSQRQMGGGGTGSKKAVSDGKTVVDV